MKRLISRIRFHFKAGKPLTYKTIFHFLLDAVVTAFLFASALSVLTVILWKGLPILQHGIPMCALLARENMLDRMLYTSCGCALVEIVALPFSVLGLIVFTPRLLRQFQYAYQRNRKP